jgi:hypothetical protein
MIFTPVEISRSISATAFESAELKRPTPSVTDRAAGFAALTGVSSAPMSQPEHSEE